MGKPSKAKKSGRGRSAYDAATKAAAITALLAGQAADQIAAEYQIPKGTVEGWKSKLKHDSPAIVATDAKVEIGQLLLVYLRENLTTLRHQQVTVFRNGPWLLQQNAADLAVLHGVITDKAVRLLEAMSAAGLHPEPPA